MGVSIVSLSVGLLLTLVLVLLGYILNNLLHTKLAAWSSYWVLSLYNNSIGLNSGSKAGFGLV